MDIHDVQVRMCMAVFGTPQDSLMRPEDSNIYNPPISTIIRKSSVDYHIFAGDTQMYDC